MLLAPSASTAQSGEGAYDSFMDWKMGNPVPGIDPSLRRTYPKKKYKSVTFWVEQDQRLAQLRNLWGLVWDDTLYLSIDRKHFVGMKEMGAFCYFTGPPYTPHDQQESLMRNTAVLGRNTGGFETWSSDARNAGYTHYVLNARTGVVNLLLPSYMRIVLGDLPELFARFEAEPDKTDTETMLRYLREANRQLGAAR